MSALALPSALPRHSIVIGEWPEKIRIGRTKNIPSTSPKSHVDQFVPIISTGTAPAMTRVPTPIVADIRQGRISAPVSRISWRQSRASIRAESRWNIAQPASAWRQAPSPTIAAMASGRIASRTLVMPSKLWRMLIAAEPIHTPAQIRGPRSSSAASATPDAGQTTVAYPGGTASERPI